MEYDRIRDLSGERKKLPPKKSIRYPSNWSEKLAGKQSQLRDWRYIAMQILHRENSSFRLVAIIDDVFDFDTCEIIATDGQFMKAAGHCGIKTIQRELVILLSLGLIVKDQVWADRSGNGKKVRTRRIRLAVPHDLGDIEVRDV